MSSIVPETLHLPEGQEEEETAIVERMQEAAWRSKRRLTCGPLCCSSVWCGLSFVTMMVGLVLLLLSAPPTGKTAAPYDDHDEGVISLPPDVAQDYWLRLRSAFVVRNDDNGRYHDDFEVNGPAWRALEWLVKEDPLAVSLYENVQAEDSVMGIQARYALVYLYYFYSGDALWELVAVSNSDNNEESVGSVTGESATTTTALKEPWLSGDECTWTGVTCNAAHQVTGLNMDRMAGFLLQGSLSPKVVSNSLNYLNLTHLVVPNQDLTGSLPTNLVDLEHLQVLDLHNNGLTGQLSSNATWWPDLMRLDLSQNNLTGTVPFGWTDCRQLTDLRLSENPHLQGPVLDWMIHWPLLQVLQLGHSGISGSLPDPVDDPDVYHRLVDLSLPMLAWTGTLPSSLAQATDLEVLNLGEPIGGPPALGSIPASYAQLTRLQSFNVESTGLTGSLPVEALQAWSNLKTLNVHNNFGVTGTVPTEIGGMLNLDTLLLSRTSLSGSIPTELGACTKLLRAEFERTDLSGPMPDEICAIGVLTLQADCDYWALVGGGGGSSAAETVVPVPCPVDCCTLCTVQF